MCHCYSFNVWCNDLSVVIFLALFLKSLAADHLALTKLAVKT